MMMKKMLIVSLMVLCSATAFASSVDIVVPKSASQVEHLAASELKSFLSKIYPADVFVIRNNKPTEESKWVISIGTQQSSPRIASLLKSSPKPEGYVWATHKLGGRENALLLGGDSAGVLYGVYGLLEKLGYGFYLTYDTTPDLSDKAFSFDGWNIENHPLKSIRMVFNWHNFLSGCTGWDLPQWEEWIRQSQKMGFNYAMVHAYGNNPMFTYSFNGIAKQVGYVATTRKGRDWGNEHVNDVRRMPGGNIFSKAEFGCEAALVSDEKRIDAKQALMKQVFAYAESRGMNIAFAFDVDTGSVLQQDMILSLPESARFHNGNLWLPRPDVEAGYAYYKTQVSALLKLYPQIDMIPIWRRSTAQEWGKLTKAEMLPDSWAKEYRQWIEKKPEADKLAQAVPSFALGKVMQAVRRALNELGRPEVKLGMGSWGHGWVPALVEFLPEEVILMPLDSNYLRTRAGSFFEREGDFRVLQTAKGRIMPIIWSHHDDGDYIGRPIHPHENFDSTLDRLDAKGYAIIHWMTRPFDLYFKHHERQVWSQSRNEPYRETCLRMAENCFGKDYRDALGDYLYRWAMDAPIFGRVTSNNFFQNNEKISDPELSVENCKKRIKILQGVDQGKMTQVQKERVAYFLALENMLIAFCRDQEFYYSAAKRALSDGKPDEARALLKRADFAGTIQQFSDLSQMLGGNRGEEAMVVSLGTRWITDYLALCQAAGLEPVRINFAPTYSEALAQGHGTHTFHVDTEGKYWSVRGQREVGRKDFVLAPGVEPVLPKNAPSTLREIAESAVQFDSAGGLMLSPIVSSSKRLLAGAYTVKLYAGPTPSSTQCEFEWGTETQKSEKITVAKTRARFLRIDCKGSNEGDWNSILEVDVASMVHGSTNQQLMASKSVSGYAPACATDGNPDTRWAAQGRHWLQIPLDPAIEFDEVKIDWYMGGSRTYNYDLLTSTDGENWTPLDVIREKILVGQKKVTLRGNAGAAPVVHVITQDVILKKTGTPSLIVKPITGSVLVYGVELIPRF